MSKNNEEPRLLLLDANVLIDANRDYYGHGRVPEFWLWLLSCAEDGLVKLPYEAWSEVRRGNDALSDWVKDSAVQKALVLQEELDRDVLDRVLDEGYVIGGPPLTESEIERVGQDPALVAYLLQGKGERVLVTSEVSKVKSIRSKRRLPDVCESMGVASIGKFELVHILDFSTDWDAD